MESFINKVIQKGKINNKGIKSVLINYDPDKAYIGDTCKAFIYWNIIKDYYKDALVHINISDKNIVNLFRLLFNHNYSLLGNIRTYLSNEIPFRDYDVIFNVSRNDFQLLEALKDEFDDHLDIQVFTLLNDDLRLWLIKYHIDINKIKVVLPVNEPLNRFIKENIDRYERTKNIIHITEEEELEASKWLKSKGLNKGEKLFVVLDNASNKYKLLKIEESINLLNHFINSENIKVLIYDDQNINKREIYKALLPEEKFNKLIFAENTNLRFSLSLLASKYTKLIIGPCTGLMHCASEIYKTFINLNIRNRNDKPLMIVYAGPQTSDTRKNGYNPLSWWKNKNHLNVILMKTNNTLTSLNECPLDIRLFNSYFLPASSMSANKLVEYIKKTYSTELLSLHTNI